METGEQHVLICASFSLTGSLVLLATRHGKFCSILKIKACGDCLYILTSFFLCVSPQWCFESRWVGKGNCFYCIAGRVSTGGWSSRIFGGHCVYRQNRYRCNAGDFKVFPKLLDFLIWWYVEATICSSGREVWRIVETEEKWVNKLTLCSNSSSWLKAAKLTKWQCLREVDLGWFAESRIW